MLSESVGKVDFTKNHCDNIVIPSTPGLRNNDDITLCIKNSSDRGTFYLPEMVTKRL